MKFLRKLIILLILVVIAFGAWIWSGAYDIGADAPHWALTKNIIGALRERSIETRASNITVPKLDDPALIAEGAAHYHEMCTGCHLAPGMGETEIRQGLYPHPPNLTHFAPDPAKAFWVIKHGIKMTAMPAWGVTHSDQKIWAIVAYLQKQPQMSVERFRQLSKLGDQAEADEGATPPAQGASMPAPAASAPAAPASTAAPAHAGTAHAGAAPAAAGSAGT